MLKIEDWLLCTAGTNRVDGFNQMFIKREKGEIRTIIAKIIDEFMIHGSTADINELFTDLKLRIRGV